MLREPLEVNRGIMGAADSLTRQPQSYREASQLVY
jgi:hypothetical protein